MDVVKVGVSPWTHMNPYCIQTRDCDAGVEMELLYTVATILNVTLSIVITSETGCGKLPAEQGSNGTGTGLLQMLREGKIDIIGNFCGGRKLAYYAKDLIALSPSVWQYHEVFVIQTPTKNPLTFRPFSPFTNVVWIFCLIAVISYLSSVTIDQYFRYGSGDGMIKYIVRSQSQLRRACFGYSRNISPRLIWPFWLLFLSLIFMFYKTFILSEVLHPFPFVRPFSNAAELSMALLSGKYRLISHKERPAVPTACLGKECEKIFQEAIKTRGFEYVPNRPGGELLSIIADQDPNATPKYVLIQGEPFIEMYFREFNQHRKRLWIVDGEELETWSSYAWRKDFRYARQFTTNLIGIGDFRILALSRYSQFRGSKPHTGDRVIKHLSDKAIEISRVRALFYLHFVGLTTAMLMYCVEVVYSRLVRLAKKFF